MKVLVRIVLVTAILAAALTIGVHAEKYVDIDELTLTPTDSFNSVWKDEYGNVVVPGDSEIKTYSLDGTPALPDSYDSRNDGVSFHATQQGNTQACWAISSVTALEADCIRTGLYQADIDLSEAHLAWFGNNSAVADPTGLTYGDGSTNSAAYLSGGYWFTPVFTLANGTGAALESEFPFSLEGESQGEYTGMGNYSESERYVSSVRLDEAEYLGQADADKIKAEIMEHGAVKASYYSYSTRYYTSPDTGICVYYQTTYTKTNHAITVVGWNDDFSVDNFKSTYHPVNNGAWLCKNSWGDEWGNDGYFWISYEDTSFSYVTAFSADSENYDYTYQYDGFGYEKGLSSGTNSKAREANIFSCSGDGFLRSAGFYTLQDNVNYTLEVYTGVTPGDPDSGTLAATLGGSAEYTGYHTVKFDENIKLEENELFSVLVTLNTANQSKVLVAAEGSNDSIVPHSSNAGESFVSFGNSTTWYDTKSLNYNNLCIKAMVNSNCLHVFDAEVTEPTCAEQGYTTHTCRICGHSYTDSYVDVAEHSYETTVTPPTCTEQGYTTHTCRICGHSYTDSYVDVAEHSYETTVTPPTCTERGYTTHTCRICGHSYTDSYVDVAEHSYETTVTEPTCTERGYTTHTCTVCGHSYTDSYVDVAEHSYETTVTPPTCTERGYTTHTCRICGHSYTDSYVEAAGHSYETAVTPPTCTERGYTTHTCTVCGHNYTDSYVEAAGHSYETTVTPPTCTERGYTTHTCRNCGHSYTDSYVDVAEHSYETAVTPPTCTERGYTTHTCTVCGYSYTDSYVEAAGHSYETTVTPPTCVSDGYTAHVCSVCGDTYYSDITPMIAHTDADGDGICDVCGLGTDETIVLPTSLMRFLVRAFSLILEAVLYIIHL